MGSEKRNLFSGLEASPASGRRDEALQFRQLWAISPARSDVDVNWAACTKFRSEARFSARYPNAFD
jgi:hypothetical protein